ncbi:preprotein translocase subunit SecA [Chloroflexota bacterium]
MFKRLTNIIGDSNEKQIKRLESLVHQINLLEPEFEVLSNEELLLKVSKFKDRLTKSESLDDLLPEVFSAVREAAKHTIGQRHFDVQLMGGIILHQGRIAEMKTGEGKTLVATLPVSLNALTGKGVHVVTVNDYLAKRDTQWMGLIYHALGLSVGCIQHESAFLFDPEYNPEDPSLRHLRPISRRQAYEADVTYGTNNEFGFDYLRDNMMVDLSRCAQRELNYAIVDEVDNILIDESRTPLIISGAGEESTKYYSTFTKLVPRLRSEDDYTVEDRTRSVTLTEVGVSKMEKWLGVNNLYDPDYSGLTRYLDNALKAYVLYKRDRDYVVRDGEVIIVDEFTGRLMVGRRYSEGLHQAIEAREGVKIQRESVTMATITFQNYFRMYRKLAGMTGTAVTEAEEFHKIYELDVVTVPTNKTMIRIDHRDRVYKNEESKFRAVVKEIEDLQSQRRPVLVGTVSIEKSEHLSQMLHKKGLSHQVLNAKQHEKEAGIITQAGRLGAVTIATNMAGRGVDIILGGNPTGLDVSTKEWQAEHNKIVELGGLHIIGTERHEARRIDNQLRGRTGRQGDPGSSRFYVSLEDDIMHRFGGDRVKGIMDWAGFDENTPLEHSLVGRVIENAQTKVEAYHFDIRKHLVEYDDVISKQREVIYSERKKILEGTDLKSNIIDMIKDSIKGLVTAHLCDEHGDNWDIEAFVSAVGAILYLPHTLSKKALSMMSRNEVSEQVVEHALSLYDQREQELGEQNMRVVERLVMLRTMDKHWVQHLTEMDHMRQGIGLQALAQRDPLVAYKREGHRMFEDLMAGVQHNIVHTIYHVSIKKEDESRQREPVAIGAKADGKVGRNDPCPCGSGKKYKRCCGE